MQLVNNTINLLVYAATDLAATADDVPGSDADEVGRRLRDCVIRPLAALLGTTTSSPSGSERVGTDSEAGEERQQAQEPTAMLDERLWDLARVASELRVYFSDAPEVQEATAALQDLAVRLTDDATGAARLAELAHLQAGLATGVVLADNGPYLVTNLERLTDRLGLPLPVRPQMALCRCGDSAIRPYCDGTHFASGWRSN